MRKLLVLISLLFCFNANADIISFDQFDNSTTITELNTAVNTIFTDYNGNISTLNIKSGTLSDDDFAVASRPSIREDELIGDMTYTGMLPATSANLTSNISAGTSYVNGYRVATDTTSKTYTASKDTYVYIDQNGAFQYVEVANGGATPTTPTNSLLLAKVVTDTDNITSVTDLRQLIPLNLRIYQDLKSGLVISRDTATATKIDIGRGEIELGTTSKVRRNTSPTYVDFTTTGIGGLDTGSFTGDNYYYIFAIADTDNSVNFEGIASLSTSDAAGVTGERLVGWCYAPTASFISTDSVGAYRGLGGDAPNVFRKFSSNLNILIAQDTTASVHLARFYTSGRPLVINYWVTTQAASSTTKLEASVSIDSAVIPDTEVTANTDNSYPDTASGTYCVTLPAGVHLIDLRMTTANQAQTIRAFGLVIEEK